jgi:putative spermidine/putrescine transport system substrate-binding protein
MQLQSPGLAATLSSRRSVLGLGLASVAAGMLPSVEARAAESLVFVGFGGPTQEHYNKDIFDDLKKELGIELVNAYGVDMAKLRAQVMSGKTEWDILAVTAAMAFNGLRDGLLEPIDYSIVTNANDLLLPRREAGVPIYTYAGGIVFDPKRHPPGKHPTTWAEFWDVKNFPGRRGLRNRPDEILELALLADGVKPKDLYPLDVDRGFRSLEKIKPHVQNWIAQTGQTTSLVRSGELDFTYGTLGAVLDLKANGVSLDWASKNPVLVTPYMVVAKGSRHRNTAMKFLNGVLSAKSQASLANNYPGAAYVVKSARALATPDALKYQPDYDGPDAVVMNDDWWDVNFKAVSDRFRAFLLS